MTDLEVYEPPTESPTMQALAVAGPAAQLIEQIVRTNFVPAAYRGKPAEALACVLTGEMLGLHPLVALREIDVIQGTPAYSAKMQRAIVQRSGHKMWLEESTDSRCVMAGHRAGDPDHVQRVTWTIDRARRMGIDKKDNWRKQPQAMLIARATGELARLIAADELLGLAYNREEVRDGTTSDEEWVEVVPGDLATEAPEGTPPAPKPNNRRSAPAKKTAAKKAAAPAPAPKAPAADPLEDFDEIDGVAAEPPTAATPPPADEPVDDVATRRAQMLNIRIREVLGDVDRAEKLAFVAASAGRAVASSKDLSSEEVDRVLVDLGLIADGRASWTGREIAEDAELVDDESAPAPSAAPSAGAGDADGWLELDGDDWRAAAQQAGVGIAGLIRKAQELAEGLGVEGPVSVPQLAEGDEGLRRQVGAWLEGQSR